MKKIKNQGFTLIEIIVVLVILAILAAFIVPAMLGYVSESKRKLCDVNRSDMVRLYKTAQIDKIILANGTLSNADFKAFVDENWGEDHQCPAGGVYSYAVEINPASPLEPYLYVGCSIHDEEEEPIVPDVPDDPVDPNVPIETINPTTEE